MDINDDYVGDRLINRSTAITRTSVPFMDEKLGWELPVLDHGLIINLINFPKGHP